MFLDLILLEEESELDKISCKMCGKIFENPMKLTPCGHTVCGNFYGKIMANPIEGKHYCGVPACRTLITSAEKDVEMERRVLKYLKPDPYIIIQDSLRRKHEFDFKLTETVGTLKERISQKLKVAMGDKVLLIGEDHVTKTKNKMKLSELFFKSEKVDYGFK